MKIDKKKLEKASSEVPPGCKPFIRNLLSCKEEDVVRILRSYVDLSSWPFGKSELYHWTDVLDRFDDILGSACNDGSKDSKDCIPLCPAVEDPLIKERVIEVLNFTAILIEHSYARHLYNSVEHLTKLLASSDIEVVQAVVHLLYIFSKRSTYLSGLPKECKNDIFDRLATYAEGWIHCWPDVSLIECCKSEDTPAICKKLHYEYHITTDGADSHDMNKTLICLDDVHKYPETPNDMLRTLVEIFRTPLDKQFRLLNLVRMSRLFCDYQWRLKFICVRLQAVSTLLYSGAFQAPQSFVYGTIANDLVMLLRLQGPTDLPDIKASVLRAFTAFMAIPPALNLTTFNCIDVTGAKYYHGTFPTMLRKCVEHLTDPKLTPFPHQLSTALFSTLYHMASTQNGGPSALLDSGMGDCMMRMLNWKTTSDNSLTFVTRAIRIADLMSNHDFSALSGVEGMMTLIGRLHTEIKICQEAEPRVLEDLLASDPKPLTAADLVWWGKKAPSTAAPRPPPAEGTSHPGGSVGASGSSNNSGDGASISSIAYPRLPPVDTMVHSAWDEDVFFAPGSPSAEALGMTCDEVVMLSSTRYPIRRCSHPNGCAPQRSALIKSTLNLVKKALRSVSQFLRRAMDTTLPQSLIHIFSNPKFYGASLFQLAMELMMEYMNADPASISTLIEESGLPGVMLNAFVVQEVPGVREIVALVPDVLSALCLNERCRHHFLAMQPFDRLLRILLVPDFQSVLRKRKRGSEGGTLMGSCACIARPLDSLIRAHDSFVKPLLLALFKVMDRLLILGHSNRVVTVRYPKYDIFLRDRSASGPSINSLIRMGRQRRNLRRPPPWEDSGGEEEDIEADDTDSETSSVRHAPLISSGNASSSETISSIGNAAANTNEAVQMDTSPSPGPAPAGAPAASEVPSPAAEPVAKRTKRDVPTAPALPVPALLKPQHVPIMDLLYNVARFIDAFAHNRSDRFLTMFVKQDGLRRFCAFARMRNLPWDFSQSSAARLLVTATSRFVQHVPSDGEPIACILDNVLEVLYHLFKTYSMPTPVAYSRILEEYVTNSEALKNETPSVERCPGLLYLSHLQTLISMCSSIVRTDVTPKSRVLLLSQWCGPVGAQILPRMQQLGQFLLWEFIMLLSINPDSNILPAGEEFMKGLLLKVALLEHPETSGNLPIQEIKQLASNEVTVLVTYVSRLANMVTEFFISFSRMVSASPSRENSRGRLAAGEMEVMQRCCLTLSSDVVAVVHGFFKWRPPAETPHIDRFMPPMWFWYSTMVGGVMADDRFLHYLQYYHSVVGAPGCTGLVTEFFDSFATTLKGGKEMDLDREQADINSLPNGSKDFIVAYLSMMTSMANAESVFKSKNNKVFFEQQPGANKELLVPCRQVLDFMVVAHKLAMQSIKWLWNAKGMTFGLATQLVALLETLIVSEKVVRQQLEQHSTTKPQASVPSTATAIQAAPAAAAAVPAPAPVRPPFEVNEQHLQQVMGMGFPEAACRHALRHCNNNLERATDYVLTHPMTTEDSTSDVPMDEEEQLAAAIALSLGQAAAAEEEPVAAEEAGTGVEPEPEAPVQVAAEAEIPAVPEQQSGPAYFTASEMEEFLRTLSQSCFSVLEQIPGSVHRTAKLLKTIFDRDIELLAPFVERLVQLVGEALDTTLLEVGKVMQQTSQEASQAAIASAVLALPFGIILTARLHLLSLLWSKEKIRWLCFAGVIKGEFLSKAAALLAAVYPAFSESDEVPTWFTGCITLCDLCEEFYGVLQNRKALEFPTLRWYTGDSRSGVWTAFSETHQAALTKSFRGRYNNEYTYSENETRQTVHFNRMVQISSGAGSTCPVMFTLPSLPDQSLAQVVEPVTCRLTTPLGDDPLRSIGMVDKGALALHESKYQSAIAKGCHMDLKVCNDLTPVLINLLNPKFPDNLIIASVLMLMRFTRNHDFAAMFAADKTGIDNLLALESRETIPEMRLYISVILHHLLEDAHTLKNVMATVLLDVLSVDRTRNDADTVLRRLTPALMRSPELFKSLMAEHVEFAPPDKQSAADRTRRRQPHEMVCPSIVQPRNVAELAVTTSSSSSSLSRKYKQVQVAITERVLDKLAQVLGAVAKSKQLKSQEYFLKLLAELALTYDECAAAIISWKYRFKDDLEDKDIVHLILHIALMTSEDGAGVHISPTASALVCSLVSPSVALATRQQFITMVAGALSRTLESPESSNKHRHIQAFCKHLMAIIYLSFPRLDLIARGIPGTPLEPNLAMLMRAGTLNLLASAPTRLDLSSRFLSKTVAELMTPLSFLTHVACAYCIPHDDLEQASTAKLHGVEMVADVPARDGSRVMAYGGAQTGASGQVPFPNLDDILQRLMHSASSAEEALGQLIHNHAMVTDRRRVVGGGGSRNQRLAHRHRDGIEIEIPASAFSAALGGIASLGQGGSGMDSRDSLLTLTSMSMAAAGGNASRHGNGDRVDAALDDLLLGPAGGGESGALLHLHHGHVHADDELNILGHEHEYSDDEDDDDSVSNEDEDVDVGDYGHGGVNDADMYADDVMHADGAILDDDEDDDGHDDDRESDLGDILDIDDADDIEIITIEGEQLNEHGEDDDSESSGSGSSSSSEEAADMRQLNGLVGLHNIMRDTDDELGDIDDDDAMDDDNELDDDGEMDGDDDHMDDGLDEPSPVTNEGSDGDQPDTDLEGDDGDEDDADRYELPGGNSPTSPFGGAVAIDLAMDPPLATASSDSSFADMEHEMRFGRMPGQQQPHHFLRAGFNSDQLQAVVDEYLYRGGMGRHGDASSPVRQSNIGGIFFADHQPTYRPLVMRNATTMLRAMHTATQPPRTDGPTRSLASLHTFAQTNWSAFPSPSEPIGLARPVSLSYGRPDLLGMQTNPLSRPQNPLFDDTLSVGGDSLNPHASDFSFVQSNGQYNISLNFSRQRPVKPEDLSVLAKWSLASHLLDGAAPALCCALYRNELVAKLRAEYQALLDKETEAAVKRKEQEAEAVAAAKKEAAEKAAAAKAKEEEELAAAAAAKANEEKSESDTAVTPSEEAMETGEQSAVAPSAVPVAAPTSVQPSIAASADATMVTTTAASPRNPSATGPTTAPASLGSPPVSVAELSLRTTPPQQQRQQQQQTTVTDATPQVPAAGTADATSTQASSASADAAKASAEAGSGASESISLTAAAAGSGAASSGDAAVAAASEESATAEASGGGDNDLPDEVDPTFLAALPEEMRAEVIAQFENNRRARQRAQNISQAAATAAAATGTSDTASANPLVDPNFIAEFLAAAPAHIAEELEAQQRQLARQATQSSDPPAAAPAAAAAAAAVPAAVAEPEAGSADFLRSLMPSTRVSVLADMDDEHVQALPEDLREEARRLRQSRQLEAVRRLQDYDARIASSQQQQQQHQHQHLLLRHPGMQQALDATATGTRRAGFTQHYYPEHNAIMSQRFLSRHGHQYGLAPITNAAAGSAGAGAAASGGMAQKKFVEVMSRDHLAAMLLLMIHPEIKQDVTVLTHLMGAVMRADGVPEWLLAAMLAVVHRAVLYDRQLGLDSGRNDEAMQVVEESPVVDEGIVAGSSSGACKLALAEEAVRASSASQTAELCWLRINCSTSAHSDGVPLLCVRDSELHFQRSLVPTIVKNVFTLLLHFSAVLPSALMVPLDYTAASAVHAKARLCDGLGMKASHPSDIWTRLLAMDARYLAWMTHTPTTTSTTTADDPSSAAADAGIVVQSDLSSSLLGRILGLLDSQHIAKNTELTELILKVASNMAQRLNRLSGAREDATKRKKSKKSKKSKHAGERRQSSEDTPLDALCIEVDEELPLSRDSTVTRGADRVRAEELRATLEISDESADLAEKYASCRLLQMGTGRRARPDVFSFLTMQLRKETLTTKAGNHCQGLIEGMSKVDRAHSFQAIKCVLDAVQQVARSLDKDLALIASALATGSALQGSAAADSLAARSGQAAESASTAAATGGSGSSGYVDESLSAALRSQTVHPPSSMAMRLASQPLCPQHVDAIEMLSVMVPKQTTFLRLLEILRKLHSDLNLQTYTVISEFSLPSEAEKRIVEAPLPASAVSTVGASSAESGTSLLPSGEPRHPVVSAAGTSQATQDTERHPPVSAASSLQATQDTERTSAMTAVGATAEAVSGSSAPAFQLAPAVAAAPAAGSSAVPSSGGAANAPAAGDPAAAAALERETFLCKLYLMELLFIPELTVLVDLDSLWGRLGDCLSGLDKLVEDKAVLQLKSLVEAFFVIYKVCSWQQTYVSFRQKWKPEQQKDEAQCPPSPASPSLAKTPESVKFMAFAESHRSVLNRMLRLTSGSLESGPFAVLANHTRVLDFDVKLRHFRAQLDKLTESRRLLREDFGIHVRRSHIFEDSFRELFRRRKEEMRSKMYVVFEHEEGQDAGGLLREWYGVVAREIFNPNYALFKTTPGDRVTYMPNPMSHANPEHLSYFKFVGRFIAKAIFDSKLLECYFTRSFYKHILGKPVHYTDMAAEDYTFFKSMQSLLQSNLTELGLELMFCVEVEEFGVTVTRDLIENGRNVAVTEENKQEYVRLACIEKMTSAIRGQIKAFLEGFYDVIPKQLISVFNEQELELLLSGMPDLNLDDLRKNTEYHKYTLESTQIQWFWRALRSFGKEQQAKFLQFVTGTSKVPLQGFAELEGMNGPQKFQIHRDDRSLTRLPCAHTCFNQLDLPPYESYEKLRHMLLLAVEECSEGFGLA